ncbi:hypothetical protein [Olivibacter jilunii]|uniref:hypothetical protein n=1 Tax=Olivibacter jilunii TaxID=985016 RepID=UPI0010313BA5|nr:hypothetical protein [Olivibacter jilunii]
MAPNVEQLSANMLYTIVTILFALSLISERVSNLIKLAIPDTRNRNYSPLREKKRELQVQLITIASGLLVSFIAGADFFGLIKGQGLINIWEIEKISGRSAVGMLLSGFFISLGSKFWHDMLDIVLEFANLKKFRVQQAASQAESSELEALAAKVKVVEPRLKQIDAYAGYDFVGTTNKVNLKFDKGFKATGDQQSLLEQALGKDRYNIISTDHQTGTSK